MHSYKYYPVLYIYNKPLHFQSLFNNLDTAHLGCFISLDGTISTVYKNKQKSVLTASFFGGISSNTLTKNIFGLLHKIPATLNQFSRSEM